MSSRWVLWNFEYLIDLDVYLLHFFNGAQANAAQGLPFCGFLNVYTHTVGLLCRGSARDQTATYMR
jgi:hypothetical protein